MLQFDKSIHPVVIYEYYLICIFMKIRENLKNEGKSHKNYKPYGGVEVRYTLITRAFLIYAKLLSGKV